MVLEFGLWPGPLFPCTAIFDYLTRKLRSDFFLKVPKFLFLVPCSLSLVPYPLFLIPCSLSLVPYPVFLSPCFSFLVFNPYSLYLVPYPLFLIPYFLSLVPCFPCFSLTLVFYPSSAIPSPLFFVPCPLSDVICPLVPLNPCSIVHCPLSFWPLMPLSFCTFG